MNDKRRQSDSERGGGDSDDMLRRRFALLRREEEQHAPEFARLWSVCAAARRQARWFAVTACALIALLAFLWILSARRPKEITAASITQWKSPTDFLLETPGGELLRTVPEFGQRQLYTVMPGAAPSPAGKRILQ